METRFKTYEKFKKAIKNPPPDRLAGIEYKSHFMQMVGITFASVFLMWKGFWYIIPAFLFGIGISYSQGMTSYKKYQMIKEFMKPENPKDFDKDISWTRRRSKIVHHVYGSKASWMAAFISVVVPVLLYDFNSSRLFLSIAYPITIIISYFVFHFYLMYWAANYLYKEEMQGKKKNDT